MKFEERIKNRYLYTKKKNIFKLIYFFFQGIKGKIKFKKSFSNQGIDLLIQYHFKSQARGVYIDVGSYHPFLGNNTYLLSKKGWSGINIDLDFHTKDIFDYFRPGDVNVEAAVSDKIEEKNLYFFHNRSAVNTLEKRRGENNREIRKVTTNTLDNIIKNSKFKDSKIDFLSVDVEGHEINVFRGFDIKKYQPKIVVIEYIDPLMKKAEFYNQNIHSIMQSEIYKYMIENNYSFVNLLDSDLVFFNNSFRDND